MTMLLDMQQAIGNAIARGTDIPQDLILEDGIAASDRLAIYRNTFITSLTSALRISFPAVNRLVGAEFFDGAAQIFIEIHPPRTAYLNAYGAEFGDFLGSFEPAAAVPYLADVARLEWAVNCALHAPDQTALDLTRLAGIAPDEIRLVPHPSVTLMRANAPVDAIWRATLSDDDTALEQIDLTEGPAWLLIAREDGDVLVTRMDEQAWQFSAALLGGVSLAEAITGIGEDKAAGLLALHLASGRVISLETISQGQRQ